MADAAFDTLATARLLRESGIEERQAAAITTAIKDGVTGGVATKADLSELRGELRSDMAEMRSEMAELRSEIRNDMANLRSDMASLETRLTVRIVIVGLALNSATAAAVIAAVGWMLAG
ncbi:MAG: DUF1640 domain-containing protein [Boseongicola sp. SB0662_bin_57]|nr:DUF1640 domain-containing protein [Boseongicola sp. SB0662_bin_57]